mmetsp:Transcript_12079/g.31607  ORF Transcript_12079/g.31607 Transcript_12079/m.31607 type:complete len:264 (+) Transcript_12079:162-953(+)
MVALAAVLLLVLHGAQRFVDLHQRLARHALQDRGRVQAELACGRGVRGLHLCAGAARRVHARAHGAGLPARAPRRQAVVVLLQRAGLLDHLAARLLLVAHVEDVPPVWDHGRPGWVHDVRHHPLGRVRGGRVRRRAHPRHDAPYDRAALLRLLHGRAAQPAHRPAGSQDVHRGARVVDRAVHAHAQRRAAPVRAARHGELADDLHGGGARPVHAHDHARRGGHPRHVGHLLREVGLAAHLLEYGRRALHLLLPVDLSAQPPAV